VFPSARIEPLEGLNVPRERVYRIVASVAVLLTLVGAAMYVVNSPLRTVTLSLFVAGPALLLAIAALNRRELAAFFMKRSSRYGLNSFLAIAAFAAIAVIVQAVSARHGSRFDLTRNKRFSLADQTLSVLGGLPNEVTVYAFFKKDSPEESRAADLLDQFGHRAPRLHFEIIDPDEKPQKARELEVVSYGSAVVETAGGRERITSLTEESLLNALIRATRGRPKAVYFVKGHGERNPASDEPRGYSAAAEAAGKESYDVRGVSLFDEPSVPEDCVVLFIAGPRKDYVENEILKISEYLAKGRSAVFLIDPQVELPNVERLLSAYGLKVNDDAIVDPYSRAFGGEYSVPVVTEYENHPITRGFDLATFFPTARSVDVLEGGTPGLSTRILARTGKSAWGETDLELIDKGQAVKSDDDHLGPVPVVAIAEKSVQADSARAVARGTCKVVVCGDSDFADNASFRVSGNSDLFLNVLNYLADEGDLVAVRPKRGLGDRLFLTESQGRFIFLVSVVLLPLTVVVFGTTVWTTRRRRG
jgi:ABC-type uncharacterized transport system involved in gliding motility auxiliary subunit